ncbi:MAG: response regulator transcription factor, partial [Actinobacteria bacterium]|nr:response regulator transcription factor [Actinomycetota bacterium]
MPGAPAILVLGRHGVARDVLCHVLVANGARTVAAEELDGGTRPDVALLVEPNGRDWQAAAAAGARVVLVTADHLAERSVVEAVLRGADGVLHGDSGPDHVLAAVRAVAGGETYLHPASVRALCDSLRSCAAGHGIPRLTGRELDILSSVDRGESVKQTARTLAISVKTVENLQTRLFRKLGVRNRAQAVGHAHALGLLSG